MTYLPDTSLEANRRATNEMRSTHWGQIMSVLRISGNPMSMEQIAEKLNWEVNRVSRRMKEMEGLQIVTKIGKTVTKSNRPCYTYQLIHQTAKIEANADLRQQDMFANAI